MGKKKAPGNRKMIQAYIQETFGIRYDESTISKLLKRLGLKRIRPKTIPGKAPGLEKQVRWVLRYFQVNEFAQMDTGILQLFGDGMHLHHQFVPTLCWGDPKEPPVFNTNSHRQRLNILGAYSLKHHHLVHHTSEENCDAQKVVTFLDKVVQTYPEHHSIILYLDNAPYFHAQPVKEWLICHPQLIIEPLPSYSPNLNLIERLWRFVKGQLVANRYYEHYKTFRALTFRLLNHLEEFDKQLDSLITENFELIWQH